MGRQREPEGICSILFSVYLVCEVKPKARLRAIAQSVRRIFTLMLKGVLFIEFYCDFTKYHSFLIMQL